MNAMNRRQWWLSARRFARLACFALLANLCISQVDAAAPGVVHGWGDYIASGRPAGLADAVDCKAANRYTYALRGDGTVALWGNDDNAQLEAPAGLSNVVAIAAGYDMGMALTGDGRVQVWGAWGHVSQNEIVNPPATVTNVIAIAAGMAHCLALRGDGSVVAWGDNIFHQTNIPPTLSNVVAIAAGQSYNLAATSDGRVVAWGATSFYGAVPSSATNVLALAAGLFGHALALRSDGTVVAWGNNSKQQASVPPGLSNVTAIAAGDEHSLALRADGSVVAWGANTYGQGSIPTNMLHSRAIAAGSRHNVLLTSAPLVERMSPDLSAPAGSNVTLQAWVTCPNPWDALWVKDGVLLPQRNAILTLTNVQSADAGGYVFIASNSFGFTQGGVSLQVSATKPRWLRQPGNQAVPLGGSAVFSAEAIGSEPLSFQWQHNGSTVLGGTNSLLVITPVSAADEGAYLLTVTNAYGSVTSTPAYLAATLPLFLTQPSDLRARTNWNVSLNAQVLSPSPVTYRWSKAGNELVGQTGSMLPFAPLEAVDAGDYVLEASNDLGSVVSRTAHVTVLPSYTVWPEPSVVVDWGNTPYAQGPALRDATNAVAIAAGTWHTLALNADGTLRIWADPQNFGLNTIPPEATNVADIFAGPSYNIVVRQDGTAVGWGGGPIGSASSVLPVTGAIAAVGGGSHALVLKRDGRVVHFPTNLYAPPNVSNIVQVATAGELSLALQADGKVLVWGGCNADPTGPPAINAPGLEDIVALSQGEWYPLALRKDGVVFGASGSVWGPDWSPIQGLSNVVEVAGGRGFAALLDTGEVRTWGISPIVPAPAGLRAHHITAGLLQAVALTTAPFFDTHPQSQTTYSGATVTLSVEVRSASSLTLQWYLNDRELPGATNAVLDLPAVTPGQSGQYKVLAHNTRADAFSQSATLTVEGPAEVLAMPPDQQLLAGDPLELQVQFAAYPPATVQWRFSGMPIPYATNATLRLASVTEAMTGFYTVTLSNLYGVVSSPATRVTVTASPPRIVTQPAAPGPLPDGALLQLEVEAAGSKPLAYQWFFNSAPLPGKTDALLRLERVTADHDGVYQARITNLYGVALSTQVNVSTFRAPPAPAIIPTNLLVREGKTLRLDSVVLGSPGASVQWRFEGVDLVGETNLALLIRAASPTNAGHYTLYTTNAYGAAESSAAQVSVWPNARPGLIKAWGLIQGAPSNILAESLDAGYSHALALLPDGTVYAWGNNSYLQTNVPVGLSNVVEISAGQYFSLALKSDGTVTGWGQNNYGQASPPTNLTGVVAIAAGASHALALKADGSIVAWGAANYTRLPTNLPPAIAIAAAPSYSLALLSDGTVRGWGTSTPLTSVPAAITNISAIAAGQTTAYALDRSGLVKSWPSGVALPADATNLMAIAAGASHALGLRADTRISAWGNDAYGQTTGARGASNILMIAAGDYTTVALSGGLKILSCPSNQTRKAGSTVALSVNAIGTPPLSYQWYHTNAPITGGTNTGLVLDSFQAADAGAYSIAVRNAFGSVQSSFTLTLGLAPTITAQPTNCAVTIGSNATFSVQCSGTPILRYQWSLNGTNLWGATTASLLLANVLPQDTGRVAVLVSNSFGTVLSTDAILKVVPPPPRLTLAVTNQWLRLDMGILQPDWPYALMVSTNLQDWIPVQSVSSPTTNSLLLLPMTNGPAMFYRLKDVNP